MRTQFVTRSIVVLAFVLMAVPAVALPPFSIQWKAKYLEGSKDEAFKKEVTTQNCNVCHDPNSKSKKDHNPYGKAVKKYLTKSDYDKIKGNVEGAKKYILEALDKAEAEKAADGQTYGEKLKAGKLPGA